VIWLAVFSCGRLVITTFLALDCVRGASLRPSFNFLKRQIGYSLPLGMSWAVPVIASRIDKIILPLYVSPANFAVYAMGAREIPLTGMITTSISTVIWPRISALHRDGDKEGLLKLWRSAVVRSSFLIFPIMTLLMAVSEKLFVLLYTDKYGEGLWPFRLYLLLVPLQGAMQGVVLSAMGRTRMVLWISILRTIFTVGVSILFIQWFGILGAPVAVLLTAYLSRVAMTWRVKRELNASVGDIFPWWQLLRILGVAAIAGVAAWAASTILPGRIISCLLGGVVMLAVYVPLIFLFRLPDEKDKELIAYNWKRLRNLFRAGKEKGDAFGNESTGGDGDNGRV
jgi:O-antigen/teichoic acid export membrane protein